MSTYDSFDALTSSDPKDSALPVTLHVDGAEVTLPWRLDGETNAILRDRHDTEVGDVIGAIESLVGGALNEDILAEHGIESAEDFQELPEEKQEALAQEMPTETTLGDQMEALSTVVHAGLARFEPSLQREDVRPHLTVESLTRLPIEEMVIRTLPDPDDTGAADAAEDGDGGKD